MVRERREKEERRRDAHPNLSFCISALISVFIITGVVAVLNMLFHSDYLVMLSGFTDPV